MNPINISNLAQRIKTSIRRPMGIAVMVALAGAALAGADLAVAIKPATAADKAVPAGEALELVKLKEFAPGIFVHLGAHHEMNLENGAAIANIGFIVGETSVMVVDPGGSPAQGRALRAAIEARTTLPISHVVLSHVHPDHVFGVGAFADVPNIVGHRKYPTAIAQRGQFYIDRFAGLLDSGVNPLIPTTVQVDDELHVDLGNRSVVITAHSTAHTDNDLSVFDLQTETLWASDLLFAQRLPTLDGSLPGWLAVMDELEKMAPMLVIPGHGEPTDFKSVAKAQQVYLNQLLREVRQHLKKNTRLAEVVELVATEAADNWLLFELRHRGNVTRAYTELEWE